MNRSSLVLAAVFAGVVGLVLLVKAGSPPPPAGPDAAIGTPLSQPTGAAAVPPGPGQIRGRTAGAALVRAFPAWSAPAPDPEEKACPCDGECGRTSAACACDAVRAKAEALLESHRRASVPLAVANSGADGSFALTGLAAGAAVDLWVESAAGIGRRVGVSVGESGVEVAVEPGAMLSGKVAVPDGAAGAVAVVAFSEDFGRVFEGAVDGAGRSVLGPVPADTTWRLLASWADQRGSDRVGAEETEFDLRLEGPALVAGMVIGGSTKAAGADVRLDAARCHLDAKADAEGRFSLTGFGAGGVVVSAQAGGRSVAEGLVLGPGQRKEDLVLDLGATTSLGGTVRGADGKPVAGAEVSYWLRRPSTSSLVPGLPLSRRVAVCAADGAWSAALVAPGPYSLQATAPGSAESEVVLLEVAAREHKQADFTLQPQSTLAGRVVDAQGKPVEGVEITVRQEMDRLGLGASKKELAERLLQRRKATVRSLQDGSFRVDGLAAGAYVLSAAKEGHGHRPEAVQAPNESLELRLLAAGGVKGEVLDERGAPAAGALVELTAPRERRPADAAARPLRKSAHADAAGKFRFSDLPDGTWLLEATPRGDKLAEASAFASATVEVRAGAEAEVRLALEATLSISGLVVDAAGRPIADARVTLSSEDREQTGTPRRPSFKSARSAADGSFELRGLEKGSFRVAARKELFKRGEPESVQAGAKDVRLQLVGMAALRGQVVDVQGRPVAAFEANGEAVADPDGRFAVAIGRSEMMYVTISAAGFAPVVRNFPAFEGSDQDIGRIVLTGGRRVTGRVYEVGSKAPIAGARVSVGVEPSAGLGLGRDRAPAGGAALTDEAGAFAMQVEEGVARLQVAHPRYKSAGVEVAAGVASVEVALARGAILRGRVLDREGRPQRALLLASCKGGDRKITEVGADGLFELGGLAGGTWRLNATASDGAEQGMRLPGEVELPEGGEAFVELRPRADGATLVVRLTGFAAGSNACGGMLFLTPEAGQAKSVSLPPSARSQSGTLTFRSLDPGRYSLLVNCGSGKKRTQSNQAVDVSGKGEQTLEIAMPAPP
ncbi:MAG TPA: carboxypeptidase-like regulatory domain-containing protein [Myxococcales bacterium]